MPSFGDMACMDPIQVLTVDAACRTSDGVPALHGVAHQISEEQMERIKETEGGGGNKDMGTHAARHEASSLTTQGLMSDGYDEFQQRPVRSLCKRAQCAAVAFRNTATLPCRVDPEGGALSRAMPSAGYQLVEVDCEFYDGQKARRPALDHHAVPLLCPRQASNDIHTPPAAQVKALAFITHPSSSVCKVRPRASTIQVPRIMTYTALRTPRYSSLAAERRIRPPVRAILENHQRGRGAFRARRRFQAASGNPEAVQVPRLRLLHHDLAYSYPASA